MQKSGFKRVEHLSDTGIEFYGNSPERLFENAAMGMFSIIIDQDSVVSRDKIRISIAIDHDSLEDLLILWLEKIIYHFETASMAFAVFNVNSIIRSGQGYILKAEIIGENFDDKRHVIKTGVKAPTYHQLEVKKNGQKWWGRVIFDI
ncbi:MAG: archease [Candidatus Humimicrobiaceae bacterium]